MRTLRIALLSSAGAFCLAATAQAQVPMPGFYIAGQGTYFVSSWPDDFRQIPGDAQGGTDNGWKAWGTLGYRFDSPWDIGIAGGFGKLSEGKAVGIHNNQLKANYWTVDGVAGYTIADPNSGFSWRPFFGVRYVNFTHKFTDDVQPIWAGDIDYWGVGPRIGIDGAYRFAGTGWFIGGGISGAVTWGKIKETGTFPAGKESRVAYNAEGQLGIGYEFSPGLAVTAGVQADYWFSVNYTTESTATGKGDRGAWGPFVRLAYNFGIPAQVAAAAPVVAPAVDLRRFVVFFDWDRSNITAQAAQTIRQAADAYRAGNNTRITASGHTDRSGSDQYNMGLSLRRANAVKAELVRDGVPAANIVVLGRGETMPLVQTADGVREPQNRRVEIVLE